MPPTYERFDSEAGYRSAIDSVLGQAKHQLRIFDHDLARLQLDAPERITLLQAFLAVSPPPRLRIVLREPGDIGRSLPRLMNLLENHAHTVTIRQAPANLRNLADCHVIADDNHCARRFHIDHARGALITDDSLEVLPWLKRFDELWELSEPWSGSHRLSL